MPNHTSLSHRHTVRSNLNSTMQSSLHDKKSVKRDQISIFTKIPSHTSTYSLCSITNVSEHILFLLWWRTKEREGCVPWNAQGVVFNMYLQFCIFGVGLGWCALHAFTLLLKIELPEVLRRSRRDPLNALPTFYSILFLCIMNLYFQAPAPRWGLGWGQVGHWGESQCSRLPSPHLSLLHPAGECRVGSDC